MAVRVARGTRVSSRRGVLLLGSALGVSIAVLAAAAPNRALASDECGAVPAGATPTVTCTPADSPYPGVQYDGVEDLTVVIQPDVAVEGLVRVTGSGDLAVDARAGSSIDNPTGAGIQVTSSGTGSVTAASVSSGYGDGVSVSGETGATVNVGTVSGDWTGVAASSNLGSVTVTSTSVTAVEGRGIFAWARAEGETISITSGTVESYDEGIYAYSGEGGSADVVVDSATVMTTRSEWATGIVAAATHGDVTVTSGSVTTAGAYSEGILVKAAEGEVYVESETVHTAGDYSTGIKVEGGLGPVELHSGVVTTDGASASGIDVYTTSGAVTVTSDEVALNGGRAAETTYGEYGSYTDYGRRPVGIDVRSTSGAVTVTSGDVTVSDGTGISVETAGNISITSTGTILLADGERNGGYGYASGIYFNSHNPGEGEAGGTVQVTNQGRIELHGSDRNGIYGYGSGSAVAIINAGDIAADGSDVTAIRVHNEYDGALAVTNQAGATIHLYDGYATGVHAGTDRGALTITNAGSIVTEGDYSTAISFHSERGAVTLTSTGTIETSGYGADAVYGHSYDGDVLVDIASVHAGGGSASGIDVWSQDGAVTVSADLVVTGDACGEGCLGGYDSVGVGASSGTGNVTIEVGQVTTGADYAVGVSAGMYGGFIGDAYTGEGEYVFGDIQVTAEAVTTSGDWAAGVQVISGRDEYISGPFGPPPIVRTGDVSVDVGTIVTHGVGSAGISVAAASAEDVLGFWSGPMLGGEGGVDPFALVVGPHFGTTGDVEVVVGSVSTDGDGAVGVYASSGFTLGFYGEGEYGGNEPGGDVVVTSGAIETAGDGAIGIVARSVAGGVTVDSGTIETSGDYAAGIIANSGGATFMRVEVGPEIYTTVPSFVSGGLVDITSDEINTSGESAAGITAVAMGGGVTVDSGIIDTEGAYANGIQIMAIGGDVSVDSTRITAHGDEAGGIFVRTANFQFYGDGEYSSFSAGDIHVSSGTIRTEGAGSDGIAVFSGYSFFGEGEYGGGDVDITSANITTLGDGSAGIRVMAYGRYTYGEDESWEIEGDVTVHSGAVITSGRYSDGINIQTDLGDVSVTANGVATSGLSSRGIDVYAENGDVVVNATAVTTSGGRASEEVSYYDSYTESWVYETRYGNASDGVRVTTEDGDVTINAQNVTVSGDQATGVLVDSENGDVTLNLGSVRAQGEAGDAVHVYAYEGDIGVNISGQVSSANGAGVHAYSYYGGVDVTLAAGSRVQGGAVGIYAYSDTGTTITINGTVSAASGLAIDVKGLGAATIHNLSNTIIGGINLTDQDDLFDNTGTFQATIDSQFGEGADLFDNTGLLQILPGSSTPGTIVFQGLEAFDNAGVVDLANGHAGDVFDLSSATWNGLAGSALELDVSGSGSDTLLVDDATGHTTIVLSGVGGGAIGQSLELVVSNSDETGNEFDLEGDNGFVKFVMDFDAATDTWSAVGTADAEVFEPGRFLAGAQNFWNETGAAWSARMTELRDIGSDRGEGVQGWVQAFGGEQSEDRGTERFTVGGLPSDVNLAYQQSYRGLQTGVDWTSGDALIGVTVGFGDSDQRMASGNSAEFGGFNIGAYGGWNAGSLFLNGLVKADVYKTRLGLRSLHASEEVDGRTWGAKAEAGWRVGGDGWFFEPSARLSWTDVDMGGYSAAGGSVEFGDASSLLGEAGARIGSHWTNGVVDVVPYLGLFALDEFDGENRTAFSLAGDTFRLTDEAAGGYGRVEFGATAVTFHGLEGFVKGEALVGGDAEGYSARLGVRWRW